MAGGSLTDFENTLKCGRYSGHVYNYKALQRVGGEPPVSQIRKATGSHFFMLDPITILFFCVIINIILIFPGEIYGLNEASERK